jgi:hypothetical protein
MTPQEEAITFFVNWIEKTCDLFDITNNTCLRADMYAMLERLCVFEEDVYKAKEFLAAKKREKLRLLLSMTN